MAFPVQPSKKGKKKIGYRRKQSSMPAMAANPVPRDQGVVVNPVAEASSHPAPKKRKDDNWRSRRAVKSAQNKASKAIAARDKAQEESKVSKGKVRDATARVKEVDHELYLHKKANRENSVKVEAEHNLAMKNLTEKFNVDLEEAYAETESATAKRLEEEARRINSEQQHRKYLKKERVYYSTKIEKEQARLAKELSGQAAVIDHLHVQWSGKMKANKLKIEKAKDAETLKLKKQIKKKETKIQDCLNDNAER